MPRKERNESMRVRQQYRKTGKKYAESGCCVYNIYTQFFLQKVYM